ncbi:leucine-rich repeat domain-containing protein [Mediterraneibacter gnavus]|uniref:leucine-rich repeat domain-containing protein n=1 Tax=Mediterraneibacter gnavus TaxID=33038 RepID=UPI0036D2FEB1
MGNVLVNEETLSAIADAVRARGGTSAKMKPAEIPEAVSRIPSGTAGADMSLPIRFFDYEGTLLYSFSLEELAGMESLPELPFHEGLICTGWNWTLEDLKKTNREMNVAALYVTDDGATRVYVTLDEDMLDPQVSFGQSDEEGVKIDWGDGSELEMVSGWSNYTRIILTHRYQNPGKYVIRFLPQGESRICFMGNYNSGAYVFTAGKSSVQENIKYLSAVRKIEVGTQVDKLDDYCFSYYSRMESITLGQVSNMGNGIVKECLSLKFLGLPEGKRMLSAYLCDSCGQLTGISIPNGITALGDYAFDECRSLKKLTIPDSVTELGRYPFTGCRALIEMEFPVALTKIGSSVFKGCQMLKKFSLRKGITEIVDSMFSNCYTLSRMVIPESVTVVERYAFENCRSMRKYYFLSASPPSLGATSAFMNISRDCKIYVPKGSLEAYQTADNWSSYASYMEEMEGDVP